MGSEDPLSPRDEAERRRLKPLAFKLAYTPKELWSRNDKINMMAYEVLVARAMSSRKEAALLLPVT